MSESKKMYIVLGIIVFMILGALGFAFNKSLNMQKIYQELENKINNKERSLVFIGAEHCGYCQLFEPTIEEMKKRYNFDYFYIDTDKLNGKYINDIVKKLDIKDFGTPYLAIVENGKKIADQVGVMEYDELFNFLQKNEIIDKESKLLLNFIDYDNYEKIIKDTETNVVVLGQTTCSHCVVGKITLNKIIDQYKIKINYLNINKLSKEEHEKLGKSFDILNSEWGTPFTMIIKNGKVIDKIEGGVPEEDFVEFFKKNNIIK